jgi:hypothetical protein
MMLHKKSRSIKRIEEEITHHPQDVGLVIQFGHHF